MTEEHDMYAGIEGKILVYLSQYCYKSAYFYRIIRQTPKTVVVQPLRKTVIREHTHGGYQDVVPKVESPFGEQMRMLKTFKQPRLVQGYVDDGTKYLELWDGRPCTEDPMCPICNKDAVKRYGVCAYCGSNNTKKFISDFDNQISFICYECGRKSFPKEAGD
jgi:hypothetical protein